MRRFFTVSLCLAIAVFSPFHCPAAKLSPLEYIEKDNQYASCNAEIYSGCSDPLTAAPKGYEPFYISHYGRHGSRTDHRSDQYAYLIAILENAQKAGVLTKEGQELLDETREVVKVHDGMDGHLTRLGEAEHKALGRKMYTDFPEVFKNGSKKVRVKSSTITRSMVSMSCFVLELGRMQKDLEFTIDAGETHQPILNFGPSPSQKARVKVMMDSLANAAPYDTIHIYERLFTDAQKGRELAPDSDKLQKSIYYVARIAKSSGVEANVFRHLDISTMYKWWDYSNRNMYINNGNSVEFGDERTARCHPLIIEILNGADEAISTGSVAADLKFAHDFPLVSLLGFWNLESVGERMSFDEIPNRWNEPGRISFASNLQIIFYRNRGGNANGDNAGKPYNNILVKFVYNGKERKLLDLTPASGPYYKWEDVRAYALEKLDMRVFVVPEPVKMQFVSKCHECRQLIESIDPALGSEAYTIDTRGDKVVVKGGDKAGLFYARQTIRQLRAQKGDKLPGLLITDKPAFKYRGGMMDCSRHFFELNEVKRFIDILAMHKMNVFHWHLTDDQGWRAEIKAFPELTKTGAWRKHTLVGHYRDYVNSDRKKMFVYDETPHGGYYTQEQMRQIVTYAAERNITVIPEIEMPGHAMAILASYPELGCTGGPYEVTGLWGVMPDIVCAGNDKVLDFYKKVLDEICEIFPSEYIHIGGDEAPRTRWKACKKCQARMKELGLKREAELQSWMVRSIEAYLKNKGRSIIGWDEILDGGVDKSATVMSWRGTAGGIRAASLGNKVIMSPNSFCYLNYYQTTEPVVFGEGLGQGHFLPLSKAYSFNPFDGLRTREKKYILGIQANLWTEYIDNMPKMESRMLPRLAALAQVAWNPEGRETYSKFLDKLKKSIVPVYKEDGLNYADYAFRTPEVK